MKLALVVEDDAALRRDVCDLLASDGWETVGASDGLDALTAISRQGRVPSVILLDLDMSRMNGREFVERLPAALRVPPIVLVSAHPDLDQVADLMGAAGWVSKPFAPVQLLEVLRLVVHA